MFSNHPFQQQTGRSYADAADKTLREKLFNARKQLVDANNAAFAAGTSTFKSAVNAFADVTGAEYVKNFLGNRKSSEGE